MTMAAKDDDPHDEISLEVLCQPLSAKVMPKSAKWSIGGKVQDEKTALASQRKAAAERRNTANKTSKRGRFK